MITNIAACDAYGDCPQWCRPEGHSNVQIGEILGVSKETVRRDQNGTNVPPREDTDNENTDLEETAGTNVPPLDLLQVACGAGRNEWFDEPRGFDPEI